MWISGLCFTKSIIEEIATTVKAAPELSRCELSRRLCERHDWRSENGHLKEMSCRKALGILQRQQLIELPPIKATYAFQQRAALPEMEVAPINCSLAELDPVSVQPVSSRYSPESKVWQSLLDTYHYLGSAPLCGAQIRYLVKSERYGVIGALAFSSAAFALAARDEYIGWSPAARRMRLNKVVCNSRFGLPASVQVPNLASHVLSLALQRLATDWEERYGVRPVLAETFVDPHRFAGTCYLAANWTEIGKTAGRRDGRKKRIYIRPLCADWREQLCQEPRVPWGAIPRPEMPASWMEEEFGTVRVCDERLRQRLYTIAEDFYRSPQASVPAACGGSKARAKAAYRFFQNKAISMDVILTPHSEATVERCKHEQVVLAPQDTTTLAYNTHFAMDGLGPTAAKGGLGLLLHDTLAFTVAGTPLGVLDAQCWARDPQENTANKGPELLARTPPAPGRFQWFNGYIEPSIEDKESGKWLRSYRKVAELQKLCASTRFVSVGDRESDIWEVFCETRQDPGGPWLLVRSDRYKSRQVHEEYLWDYMAGGEAAAEVEIHIPRSGSQSARDAHCELRYARVEVKPPQRCAEDPPIGLWAVYLLEDDPEEEVAEPLEWLLLTTAPVETIEEAITRVEWYQGRWGIELFHRTLKSGCCIEDRQFGDADTLEACLGVDMVVAWRIYYLTMLGRETPELPCTVFFNDIEWKTLYSLAKRDPVPPEIPPTIAASIYMLGKIGGHLGRKGDGPPGIQVLWKGLQKMENAVVLAEIHGLYSSTRQRAP